MIICSYYTQNTPYESVIKDCLIPGLKKYDLEYDIEAIDDLGDWQNNTGYKSKLIKKMLLKHKQPVCFLDADAKIAQYPELLFNLPKDIDIAYHHFNWFGFWRGQWENKSNIQLLSGTMTFSYNEKVLSLVDEWINKVSRDKGTLEQKILDDIVTSKTDLNIYDLPMEYCCIIKSDGSICDKVTTPVILHCQASRQYKRGEWRNKK